MSANLIGIVGCCGLAALLSTNCGGRTPLGGEHVEETGLGGTAGSAVGGGAGFAGTVVVTGGSAGTAGTYGAGGFAGTYGGGGGYAGNYGGSAGNYGGAAGSAGSNGGAAGYAGTYGAGGFAGSFGGAGGAAGFAGSFGGAAGNGGFGGTAGSGGATPIGCPNAPQPTEDLVDDMNDGDPFIIFTNGRAGAWTTYHDTQTPNTKIYPDGVLSMSYSNDMCHGYAAHVVGGPYTMFAGFSAGLGGPYNASGYYALSFWAMSATATTLRVAFPDIDTDPAGARCNPGGGPTGCYDHFGTYVPVTPNWTKITVRFNALSQDGWGNLVPAFRPDTVFSVQFNIAAPQSIFDVWVDDVTLNRQVLR